jgi:hypothetical protein
MTMHQKMNVLIFIELVVVVGIYERCAHVCPSSYPKKMGYMPTIV